MKPTRALILNLSDSHTCSNEILLSFLLPSALSCLRLLQHFCDRAVWLPAGPKHYMEARSVAFHAGPIERGNRWRPGLRPQSRYSDVYLPRADPGECCSRQVGPG